MSRELRSTLSEVLSSALLESSPHPENKFTLSLSISWLPAPAILFAFSTGSALSVSWCSFAAYSYFGISAGAPKKYIYNQLIYVYYNQYKIKFIYI